MTGQNDRQMRVWPVKSKIRPDIVRWSAVILSPAKSLVVATVNLHILSEKIGVFNTTTKPN